MSSKSGSKKRVVKRGEESEIESTGDEINKSKRSKQTVEQKEEHKKGIKLKVIDKMEELMKLDEEFKDCGLPEKYKEFLIDYSDPLKLAKYKFIGFDPKDYKDVDSLAKKLVSDGHPENTLQWLEKDGFEDEKRDQLLKKFSSSVLWLIASGESGKGEAHYFIDLNASEGNLPVYKFNLETFDDGLSEEWSSTIRKVYADINDFLTVARLQAITYGKD